MVISNGGSHSAWKHLKTSVVILHLLAPILALWISAFFLSWHILGCLQSCCANSANFTLVLKPPHLFLTLNKGDISAQNISAVMSELPLCQCFSAPTMS